MRCRRLIGAAFVVILSTRVAGQSPTSNPASSPTPDSTGEAQTSSESAGHDSDKRIFGIIPNYRTSPTLTDYTPLSPGTKYRLAEEDAFDRGTFILAGLFAGQSQWTQAAPSFGHGVGAYGRYYSAALADLIVGDFMTEAVYPRALHQDPRYFRRGTGSAWGRLGYAVGQIVWTHTDSGGGWFNASEVLGNATAVAIGNAYYPDGRTFSRNATRWSWQIGTDAAANILKEFWPDLDRKFGHHSPVAQ
ncbi:MAG TPA: hypothetical protein VKB36_19645 [Vicinamibacterales bacterium]|nr:hypothetical protein [Vicinamibacterales bacterium]